MSIALGACVCIAVLAVRIHDNLNWRTYFHGISSRIDTCRIATFEWPGSHQSAMDIIVPSQSISLPLRGNPDAPKVIEGQGQLITCNVNLEGATTSTYSWISLARLYGDTIVYWNKEPIAATNQGDRIEFPPPMASRGQANNSLTIVSKGRAAGNVGPWTLIPPYVAINADEVARVQRYLGAVYVEHPVFNLGVCTVFLCFVVILWFGLFRFWDIAWVAVFLLAVTLFEGGYYAQNFFPGSTQYLMKMQGAALLTQMIALFCYLSCLSRNRLMEKRMTTVGVFLIGAVAVAYFVVSPESFFRWRMLLQLPLWVGSVGLLLYGSFFILLTRGEPNKQRRDRMNVAAGLSMVLASVYFLNVFLDERYSLNLLNNTQVFVVILVLVTLTLDLVKRYKEYFVIKAQQTRTRSSLEWSSYSFENVAYLKHDLMKPIIAMERALTDGNIDSKTLHEFREQLEYAKSLTTQESPIPGETESGAGFLSAKDISDIVHDSYSLSKSRFIDREVEFVFAPPRGVVKWQMSRRDLSRMLVNLFDNAFDATRGGFLISVEVVVDDNKTRVTVKNTGSTLTATQLETIFHQGVSTRNSSHNQGLGLSFCQDTLEKKYAGSIRAVSDKDSVSFILETPSDQGQGLLARGASNIPSSVALIDDDPTVLMQWSWQLGAKVQVFSSCAEFWAWWNCLEVTEKSSVVVITDMVMGDEKLAGLEILQKIKRERPDTRVILSSNLRTGRKELQTQYDGVISKEPLDWERLLAVIQKSE